MPKVFHTNDEGDGSAYVHQNSEGMLCPTCGKEVGEPHEFVVLSVGALPMKGSGSVNMPKGIWLDAFFEIVMHGAHKDGIRRRWPRDTFVAAQIGKNYRIDCQGQIERYFCSVSCLRQSFNMVLDEFERSLKTETAKQVLKREREPDDEGKGPTITKA